MFDFTNVESSDFNVLEPGWYHVFVDEAVFHQTKAGTGEYLKVTFKTISPVEGRLVWGMYNLINPNPKAVEIALRDVTALLSALGYKKEKLGKVEKHDLLEMIDQKELMIKLKTKTDDYGDKNVVAGYKSLKQEQAAASDVDIPF